MRSRGLQAGIPISELPPAPEVALHLLWVWRAFVRLSADRPWLGGGMGAAAPGRIPWATVRAWAAFYDMTNAETEYLDRCLTAMDEVFAKYWKETNGAGSGARLDDKLARWEES